MTLCLYRIAQEGLRNVAKHANADHVVVTLTQTADGVQLSIFDNGKGFDLAGARAAGRGLGLMSIDERARLLRGSVRFETRPQQDTRIHVEIPWPAGIAPDFQAGVSRPTVTPRTFDEAEEFFGEDLLLSHLAPLRLLPSPRGIVRREGSSFSRSTRR